MHDPHVVSLTYRAKTDKGLDFDNPAAVEYETDSFGLRLEGGVLTVKPKDHFSNPEDVQSLVGSFLEAWEVDFALRHGRRDFRFTYEGAEVVDRDPRPSSSIAATGHISSTRLFAPSVAHATAVHKEYPRPPQQFSRLSPDAANLWDRYERYLSNREPLPAMGYYCLTLLETKAGGRKEAAVKYGIDTAVLKKLGGLTSTKGDPSSARKFGEQQAPLTEREKQWIRATLKAVIRRVAEFDCSSTSTPMITIQDLPQL